MAPKCTIDQIKDVLSDLQSQLDAIKQSKQDTVVDLQSELDATTQSKKANEEPVEEKRPSSSSWWGRIRGTVRKGLKVKKESSTYASDSGEGSQVRKGKRNSRQDQEDANLEILKLQNDIRQMKAAFEKLAHFQSNISKSLEIEVPSNKLRAILLKTDSVKSRARDLKEIRRKVLNLKGQIPSLLKKQSSIGLSITDSQTAEENGQIIETGSDILLPGLHVSYDFKHSSAFEEVVEKFEVLEFTDMLCLLSLAVFPENKEVKRTMLMYWWIGEGFISYEDSENTVTRILDEFSRKGLIEAVEDERKLKPSGYKMEPYVHAAVVYLASRMELFDLYSQGKLKMQYSERKNVCLVKRSSLQQEAKASKMPLKNLNSVFNSSERYPDFTFKWFPEMESLKVLYLGRWERTAKRHIEVESTEFLKDMKSLKSLRLASFQGISRIENLKDLTCSLPKLVILDLRACYNLEGLPEDIGSLENLIYLDVSECYMLDRMPDGISDLKTLQVLKGFVISQSDDEKECAVKHLENLRKLSITVNRYQFKVEDFMESLKDLKQLESLKIAWGARFSDEEGFKGGKMEETDKTKGNKETPNEEKHKDPKEGEDDQMHKKKAYLEEEKKHHEVNAESLKSDEVVEGDKGKDGTEEEGKKQDKVVDAEKSRSEDGVEGVKKASPSSESTKTIENKKTDDKQEEKRDGEKEKVNPEEGKKKDEVTSPPQESKETVKSKPDDNQRGDKQEEKRDAEKDKTEGEKKDELKAENSEPGKVDKKTSPPQESKDTVTSKQEDHQRGDIQEEKRDGEKDLIEEGNKKHEVKAVNSKPEKTSPAQQSKDTIHSKGDDNKENSKDGEKIKAALKKPDEGEEKNQKSDKQKLNKKVSFSEEPRAPIQKKPATKESGSRISKLFTMTRTETKKQGKGRQEDSGIDTSKLPSSLKKLELECYPEKEPPVWLNPKTLDNLTKLSIKGGNLTRFSDEPLTAENKCGVQILRLKYLHEFKAEWKDLKTLFPQLKLLEKYKCPEVAFCPTDGNGVWRSHP
ncbi:hypothetical protein N665_0104s0336 [Sinapis alba]|nr:hypothetical protein N665_0104s0336 [Sinapis alba]KAF8109031.1 hypothetical protein N665_0104s0336 [Sinapis alba]